jgi:hypothetical protein
MRDVALILVSNHYQILTILDKKINAGKSSTGRPGMDLWEIFVGLEEVPYQTIYDNVSLLDDDTLREINAIFVSFGQQKVFKKKRRKLCLSRPTALS